MLYETKFFLFNLLCFHQILIHNENQLITFNASKKSISITFRAVPRAGPAGPRPEAQKLGRRKF